MTERWKVLINGELYVEDTGHVAYAVQCALREYAENHVKERFAFQTVKIEVSRSNQLTIPVRKIANVRG